jgi:thymidylate kinase
MDASTTLFEELAPLIGDEVRLLQGLSDEPRSGGGDLDCVVSRLDHVWPLRLTGSLRLCQCLRYDVPSRYWVLERGGEVFAIDTLEDPRGLGRYAFRSQVALDGRGMLAPASARAAYLTAKRLGKGMRDRSQWIQVHQLACEDPGAYAAVMGEVFGRRTGLALARLVLEGSAPTPPLWKRARRTQRLRRLIRGWVVWLPLLQMARVLGRLARPTGCVVLVAGPDGSGKSSFARALPEACHRLFRRQVHQHWRPALLPRPGSLVRKEARDWTRPHDSLPHGRALSLVLLLYYWLDFALGSWLWIWPMRARTGLVVVERGWWDLVVDPRRYRLQVPAGLVRALARLLPKPDLALVLEAPPEVLLSRKTELSKAEMTRQTRAWRDALPERIRQSFLDASRPFPEVLAAGREELVSLLESRASARLGAGWIRLPNSRSRVMIPRGPRRAARRALSIYQPFSLRGRFGWEAARLVARSGALRLLPRGEAPPRAVREALAPHLPPRSTFALAETYYLPGRFVAVIVDERGASRAVAKIATEEKGRDGLDREAEALESLGGPLLPAPLSAPRVLARGDHVLLLEAVEWVPRRRPWRLPEEVAWALGGFFRAGAQRAGADHGPAHGDFAPWNLLRTRDGWVVVDWEEALDAAPPFFDLFHHVMQSHFLLGRPSQPELLAGLDRKGWVASAISAYSAGAEISPDEARDNFVAYLTLSGERLDPSTRGGKQGLTARRELLRTMRR